MADIATFFAQASCFFGSFWAFVFRWLSSKPESTTPSDDLEVGIPPDTVKQGESGHLNATLPVVSDSGPVSVHMLPEDYPKPRLRNDADSFSDLLDRFPTPPTYNALPKIYHDVVQVLDKPVPVLPKEYVRPFVAPLRIVKKNKIRPTVVPLGLAVARGPESGGWEQEDRDFCDLFYGDTSFVSQSSIINISEDDRGDLDDRQKHDGDRERRLEDSFDSIEKSIDEMLSILIEDLVALKVEDPANVSLSFELAVSQRIIGVEDEIHKVNLPVLRFCDCEGYEDSYSWTAATDDDDDNHSQEDDRWSDRLEAADQ